MEQMNNEQQIYNAALYCRLSKDDETTEKWNVSLNSMHKSFPKSRGMYASSPDLL
jgi:hypothetical protein